MFVEAKNEQRKRKKLTLKNFKGTPPQFNETNLKAKGKVLVERKITLLNQKT